MKSSLQGCASTMRRVVGASFSSEAAVKVQRAVDVPGALFSGIHASIRLNRPPGLKRLNRLLASVTTQKQVDKLALPILQLYNRKMVSVTQETTSLYAKICCNVGDIEKLDAVFTKAGRRELGLPAPSAKTQKYAMIAMERANEAPKLLQLIQSIESPDSAMFGIGVRACIGQEMHAEARDLAAQAQANGRALPAYAAQALSSMPEPVAEEVEAPAEEEAAEEQK